MKIFILAVFFSLLLVSTKEILAQGVGNPAAPGGNTFQITRPAGYGVEVANNASGEGIVGTIIKNVIILFYAIGGIGVVVYFLWGAVDWVLSGGDKEKVSNARKKMTHALIGLILLALSFVMIRVVGNIVGFNPLCQLQIRGLGDSPTTGSPNVNCT